MLVLVWTCTRGSLNVLQLVFGLALSNLSVYLRFGIRLMVETFKNDPLARVAIHCNEDIESFKAAFAKRHPLLNDCWVMMDGLKLYLQSTRNSGFLPTCFFYLSAFLSKLSLSFIIGVLSPRVADVDSIVVHMVDLGLSRHGFLGAFTFATLIDAILDVMYCNAAL